VLFPREQFLGIAVDGHKRKVLVVDDHHIFTDLLAEIFNHFEFDASVAYDGVGAVECEQRISPELVIMNVRMEGMNGVEAATSIRKCLPNCKILLHSGSGRIGLLEIGRAQGYEFEWLGKPVDPNTLLHWLSVEGTHDVRSQLVQGAIHLSKRFPAWGQGDLQLHVVCRLTRTLSACSIRTSRHSDTWLWGTRPGLSVNRKK